MTWLTPFTDFFCQFWSARVGFYYHTNEQDVKQNASIIGQLFSKQGSEKIRIDWDREISRRTEGKDVSVSLSTRYRKSLLHQAAPVIDRLSSLEETGHDIYCAAR